jgi:hypothetical protein
MMKERILTGRITRLVVFRVPEFGTRASFHLECAGRHPTVCAVAGDVARELTAHYREKDMVVVRDLHESRPSSQSFQLRTRVSSHRRNAARPWATRGEKMVTTALKQERIARIAVI